MQNTQPPPQVVTQYDVPHCDLQDWKVETYTVFEKVLRHVCVPTGIALRSRRIACHAGFTFQPYDADYVQWLYIYMESSLRVCGSLERHI